MELFSIRIQRTFQLVSTYMKKEQSAKLLKEIEKFNFIKYNDLLTIQ